MLDFFRSTLPGWQWALLALVPPAIIALYFLKLRRQPLEVPSTYLWKRSIEDLHVNSLWQRLRQNLLLFLQLLLVALAMLALLRPGWEGTKLEGERFIFLVDNSASMSATDVEEAENRLAAAKLLVRRLIDQMESHHVAMIVSFADTPQVVQEFTDNRRLLRERLASIEPTVRGTDLRGALDLADGLANPGQMIDEGTAGIDIIEPQAATVYILSDGRFEDVRGFSLGNLTPVYVPIGSFDAANLAITGFSTRRSEVRPEERQAFVQVASFTDEPQRTIIEVALNGQFLDAKEIEVPADEVVGVVFPLADAPAGALTATLKYELGTPTGRDALAQDDVAFAALNDAVPGQVLVVTPGNEPLAVALATSRADRSADVRLEPPEFLESDEYEQAAQLGAYDLVIYDQCVPKAMPRGDALFVGRLPPGLAWRGREDTSDMVGGDAEANDAATGRKVVGPQIIDWDRSHPLMASVELGNVDIADSLVLEPPPGSSVLIDSTAGPIAAIAPRDAYQDVVLGFEIFGQDEDGSRTVNTNWPRRLSFPTFWLNVLEHLASGMEDSLSMGVRPGRPVELRVGGNVREVTVVDPTGKSHTVRRTGDDVFQFHDTRELGIYEVRQGDAIVQRFAVNLFDRQESDIRLRPSQDSEGVTVQPANIRIGHVDVAATLGQTPARQELWKVLLAAALVVLVVEWYIYNRRVYV